MATVELANDGEFVDTGNDSIVIKDKFASIRGGRALDVTGYNYPVIHAGHPIIQETASKEYKPMPVNGAAIQNFGNITPGSGYAADGTYNNVALTGGSGSLAVANIVVTGGKVTKVTLVNGGKEYKVGDSLSAAAANIGGTGTGFAVTVSKINYVPSSFASLPTGHTYAGILIASIQTRKAFAGILVQGTVNPAAAMVDMTNILSAVKTALPLIDFRED